MAGKISNHHTNRANKYARDVVNGKIPACLYIIQACKRHLDDLESSKKSRFPYVYDPVKGEKICNFVEKMPHIKGKWVGTTIKLQPWQEFILTCLFGWVRKKDGFRRFKELYAEIPRKNSKALALDTLVPTPEGIRRLCDIRVGDSVFGSDGNACVVIGESEVFTDHDCYEVEFSTGERVVADAGHLWETTARVNQVGSGKNRPFTRRKPPKLRRQGRYWASCNFWEQRRFSYADKKKAIRVFKDRARRDLAAHPMFLNVITRVRTTDEVYHTQRYSARGDINHSVRVAQAVELLEKKYPIDPYVLGYWIGDGASSGGRVTVSYGDAEEFVRNVEARGEPVHETASSNTGSGNFSLGRGRCWPGAERDKSFGSRLRKLNLVNNKHIPEGYLLGSVEQRFDLLRGLMDSDGTVAKTNGQCSFSNKNKRIIDSVYQLVASLGLKPSVQESRAVLRGKDCGASYSVAFMAFSDTPVFRLKRKLDLQKERSGGNPRSGSRQIVKVTPVPSVPVKCICVDSPGNLFLITEAFIPTHNSTIGAGIGNYMFTADGEPAAEVFSGATSLDQAMEVFRPAWKMSKKTPPYLRKFGIELGGTDKNPGAMYSMETDSRFEPVVGKPGDGASPHCAIVDEYHEHDNDHMFDCFATGMGAREQPLLAVITTAGTNTEGPCYNKRTQAVKMLSGKEDNPELFAVIYTIDKEDDWTDFEVWKKANPNYEVSVFHDFLFRQYQEALRDARKQNILKCKHLNIWNNAAEAFFNMVEYERCSDSMITLNDFYGEQLFLGLDLASKIDLVAMMLLFRKGKDYYLFSKYFLPEARIHGEDMAHYAGWVHEGYIETFPGERIDFEAVQAEVEQFAKQFDLSGHKRGGGEVCNDPWNAQQMVSNLEKKRIAITEIPQTAQMLSEPMKEIEAVIKDGRLHHDGNPVTYWCFSNTMVTRDKKDNVFPFKLNQKNKLDGLVATVNAMCRAMVGNDKKPLVMPQSV